MFCQGILITQLILPSFINSFSFFAAWIWTKIRSVGISSAKKIERCNVYFFFRFYVLEAGLAWLLGKVVAIYHVTRGVLMFTRISHHVDAYVDAGRGGRQASRLQTSILVYGCSDAMLVPNYARSCRSYSFLTLHLQALSKRMFSARQRKLLYHSGSWCR